MSNRANNSFTNTNIPQVLRYVGPKGDPFVLLGVGVPLRRNSFCTWNGLVPRRKQSLEGEKQSQKRGDRGRKGRWARGLGKSGLGLEETWTRTKAAAGRTGLKGGLEPRFPPCYKCNSFYITSRGCQQRPAFPSKTSALDLCHLDVLVGWDGLLDGS